MTALVTSHSLLPPAGVAGPVQLDTQALRPDDLSELMRQGRLRGIRIEEDPRIQEAMSRFRQEFLDSQDAYSPRTVMQLRSMWGQFDEWCIANELQSCPAELETVKRYLSLRAEDKHRNTLAMDNWAIGKIHRESGCPDPTIDTSVKKLLKALTRKKIIADEGIKQASPLRECYLDELEHRWSRSPLLADKRDIAILMVAYESMLRVSELARIKLCHLKVNPDRSAVLLIPRTKTNHSGEPDVTVLSRQARRLVQDYLEAAERPFDTKLDEPLFIGITRYGKCANSREPLRYSTFDRLYHRAWEVLDLESAGIQPFTCHSTRVGAAQDLATAEFNALQIQQSGRWANESMVLRYCRGIMAEDGAMAKFRNRRR